MNSIMSEPRIATVIFSLYAIVISGRGWGWHDMTSGNFFTHFLYLTTREQPHNDTI